MKPACPACAQSIALDDINVQTDLALCRGCGQIVRLSEINEAGFDESALRHPPKGAWYRQTPTETVVGATTRHGSAFFLVPFLCVWSGGSLGGIFGSQIRSGNLHWGLVLCSIPFLVGSVFLGSITLMSIGGKVEVRLRGRRGEVFVGIGPLGWKRLIDIGQTKTICEGIHDRSPGIELKGRSSLRFGANLSEARRRFVLNALRLYKARQG